MQTLIQNATLVLPNRIIEGGWLLIEDERILDLGEEATCPMVTLNPAQAVGLDKEYGALERGKIADVILVKFNQLKIPAVQRVFVRGEERLAACRGESLPLSAFPRDQKW